VIELPYNLIKMMDAEPYPLSDADRSDCDDAGGMMLDVTLSKEDEDYNLTPSSADDGSAHKDERKDEELDQVDGGKISFENTEHQQYAEDEAELVASAMTLEVAYQSVEMVRKLNLQLEFGTNVVDDSVCVMCLRTEPKVMVTTPAVTSSTSTATTSASTSTSRFGSWVASSSASISNNLHQRKIAASAASACFTCGTPVCKKHRSSEFGKQNIIICLDCSHLFSTNYLLNHVVDVGSSSNSNSNNSESNSTSDGEQKQNPTEDDELDAKKRVNNMLDVYDRSLLVLRYSLQYIDEVATALRTNTSRHNRIGLGSSATGVVAGGLGVAAACTIWTPVGPPLLLASILFGGGATAVNAGSEAVNYRCEPNKMADRILTLHSIVTSIAQLPGIMDHRIMMREEEKMFHPQHQHEQDEGDDDGGKFKSTVQSTITLSNPSRDEDQSQLHWTRTAMNGLKPLTMGALSAVSIVTEAREMKRAVDKIRAGNPCDKAERLLAVKDDIKHIPNTEDLAHQLHLIVSRQKAFYPSR
jgi:hypothetical protein